MDFRRRVTPFLGLNFKATRRFPPLEIYVLEGIFAKTPCFKRTNRIQSGIANKIEFKK